MRALVAREARRRLVAYDVNVRLNVVPQVAAWRDALEAVAVHADLVKLSDEDLALLAPGADEAAFAARLRGAGVAWVVVTRGAAGAAARRRERCTCRAAPSRSPTPSVRAIPSRPLCWPGWPEQHRLDRETLLTATAADARRALAFAVHAASITCTRRGADLPRRAELPLE